MSVPQHPDYKDSGVGWLGKVPQHWLVVASRRLFRQRKERASSTDRQLTASQSYGVIFQDDFMEREGRAVVRVIHGADILKHVEPNDFVISMRSFQGGIEWCGERGCVSSAYVVLVPNDKVVPQFFRYLLKSDVYIQALQSTTNLVRDGQAMRYENFTQIELPDVQEEEQFQIATFLDRETAKIDELIQQQQRLIELLEEKRQAVIAHVVTKGLNSDVPMKDSGSEWMGKVPRHWRVLRLGRVTAEKCDGPFGSGLKSEHYTEHGVRVIRLQNIRAEGFDDSDSAFIGTDYYRKLGDHDVQRGDLLIAGLGDERNFVGRACVAPSGIEPAMVKADCFRFRLYSNEALPEFVASQLSAGANADAGIFSTGSTRSRIPLSVMSSRMIALPPPAEQGEIQRCLSIQLAELQRLSAEAQKAIQLLQERRRALISLAVTGKIDVRQMAEVQTA
jgi:type I restriction enzyme S subunit